MLLPKECPRDLFLHMGAEEVQRDRMAISEMESAPYCLSPKRLKSSDLTLYFILLISRLLPILLHCRYCGLNAD